MVPLPALLVALLLLGMGRSAAEDLPAMFLMRWQHWWHIAGCHSGLRATMMMLLLWSEMQIEVLVWGQCWTVIHLVYV